MLERLSGIRYLRKDPWGGPREEKELGQVGALTNGWGEED